jgi:HK97 family phage prohead protease
MLFGYHAGELEVRRAADGGAELRGAFPYGERAILSDGGRTGRPQKEVIAPRAFAYRVERPDENIHLLVGHSYDQPLASKETGTLKLRDTDKALLFEATITPAIAATTHALDILALIRSGLAKGISPGFRIPPRRAVPAHLAEEIEEEPDDGELDADGNPRRGAIIRTVKQALLFELSVVTRPAYEKAQLEARDWTLASSGLAVPRPSALRRWRP